MTTSAALRLAGYGGGGGGGVESVVRDRLAGRGEGAEEGRRSGRIDGPRGIAIAELGIAEKAERGGRAEGAV